MAEKKFILISMDDNRAKKLADVLGNKTCNKIIDFLAEKNASEKDIADALKIPINTIEYNLNKLLSAGLVEKSKNYFWSRKGKKIDIYKVSNKSIIISPKNKISSKIKSIVPAVLLSLAGTIGIKYYYSSQEATRQIANDLAVKSASAMAESENYFSSAQAFPVWGWFLIGSLTAILIITIINWRKL
ncbi:MAG: helix-turn-helix domain-containing protein [Candidatus Woesearchaeota archaeon]|jgi:predicted transcriptional regulator